MQLYSSGIKWFLLLVFAGTVTIAGAQNLNNPNKLGPLGTQVNTLSGNVFLPRTDIFIPARGFNLDISFYYNSYLFNEQFGYGKGWTFEYNIRYKTGSAAGSKLILWGDGREDQYDSIAGGSFKTPTGFYSKLSQYQPGKYLLTEKDSVKYFFNSAVHRKVTRMEEPNGNFINFNYTDSLLTSIVNAAGQTISFTYDAQGRLATVTDAMASPTRTFAYSYDAAGNLTEVKDPLNGKYQYSYLVNGPMKSVTDKNNNKVDIIYFPDMSASELIGCNKRVSFSYDTSSSTTVVTDHLSAGNQVTKYTYKISDNIGWITSRSGNCCGYNMNYEYDDKGNQVKVTDANGQVYKYTYDANGNMLTATDPLNQVSTYTYTTNFQRLNSFKDPKGNLYTLAYDAKGNLTQLTAPGNNTYTATYNTAGDIISSTDPRGNTYNYSYDAFGNPVTVTGPHGYTATLAFDARGRLLAYTDARGNGITAEYDILDRLKKITDPYNNFEQFNYDAEGNLISYSNKKNETSLFNYDAGNRLVKTSGPTGNQTFLSYDGMDNFTGFVNAMGYDSRLTYDNRNRVSGVKDPANNNAIFSYDGNGNITGINLPNGRSVSYTYDALNRVTVIRDATGTIGQFSYDKNGNITSYTNGTGAITTAAYDSLNRLKQLTDALGNSTSYGYDKNNNIISIKDREGRTRFYSYDSLDRVKTYTDNNGFVITVGYDAQSNITSLKDQNNNTTTYTYDSLNRRKTMTFPDGKFMQYGYDKKSNLTSIRLTDATVINYQYDTLNRIISRSLPGGEVYSYSYDKLNRVLTATNNSGTVSFNYDNLNRVISETFDGRTTAYNYNVSGRTQTTVYPDNTKVIKEFDTRNRLIKVLKDSVLVAEYTYNNADQLISKNFANGVSTTMQYDFANRLSNISTSNGTIQNTSFTYDKERNKTAINRTNNPALSEQFSYDNSYRLTNYKRGPAGSPTIQNTYTYDAVGNRTAANLNGAATTYGVNNLNQLTGINSTVFTFDNRGNLTYDGTFYKTYDAENRLKKDSSSPTSVIIYGYDAMGRRVTKTLNGITLKYTYSGAAAIEERNSSNVLLNRTVFTDFLTPVLNEKNGSKYYYHHNELGSVEAISNSSGRLLESYRYDVYGKQTRYDSLNIQLASSLAGNRFGFTGQEYDSATNSYRFYFRNYSTATGTFNQRDPIEYMDGMGMYQYVGNNPANGVDVWGLKEVGNGKSCSIKTDQSQLDETTERIKLMKEYWDKYGKNLNSDIYEGGKLTLKIVEAPFEGIQTVFDAKNLAENAYNNTALENTDQSVNVALGVAGTTFAVPLGLNAIGAYGAAEGATVAVIFAPEIATAAATGAAIVGGYKTADKISQKVFGTTLVQNNLVSYPGYLFGEYVLGDYYETGNFNRNLFYQESRGRSQDWLDAEKKMIARRQWYKTHPNTCDEGGTRIKGRWVWDNVKKMFVLAPEDPNLIIGPDGQPGKKWVSIKDRMPYTIQFENDTTATARTRYIKITTPVQPKQDPATLELGTVGFNNQSFEIPAGTSSYYQRLDARDSTGVYVDLTAGYDVISNQVFWEFQAIDPITLLTPEDPLAGFLFLQDTAHPEYGNGFVNFSIKPISTAHTLDTIAARAFIVFDSNDTIPTNIHTNTIDALASVSSITALPALTPNTEVNLHYTGADDPNGSGVKWYSIFVSDNDAPPELYVSNFTKKDTSFNGLAEHQYKFYASATDTAGNIENLKLIDSTKISSGQFVICPNGSTSFDARLSGASYQWQVDNGTGFSNITNGGVYSGANTAVLSLNNAPTSMYGFQYRCLVNGSTYSQVFLLKFGMTWEGSVSTAWENPANWSCGSLPDDKTDVIINGGKSNYPQVNSNVIIRTLKLNTGASGIVNTGFSLKVMK